MISIIKVDPHNDKIKDELSFLLFLISIQIEQKRVTCKESQM